METTTSLNAIPTSDSVNEIVLQDEREAIRGKNGKILH